MNIRNVIIRCAMYKLMPQYRPSRVAIRNVVNEIADITPVIAYEISEAERKEITEIIYKKLDLNEV